MKKFFPFAAAFFASLQLFAQPGAFNCEVAPDNSVEYFYTVKNVNFNPAVPSPQKALGFNIGERHVEWGDVLCYVNALAQTSDRVSFKKFGLTFEKRPFIQVYITSPANQARLEQIREEHLKMTDTGVSSELNIDNMPLVIDVMGTIHGNEASGVNAIMPLMYYYAASEDDCVKELLDKVILIFTPGQNPDGLTRFAQGVNAASSINYASTSSVSREHNLPWPSARTNHYFMDVNRDWLTAQMQEGKNFVRMYEYWMPNVVLDLHEQGNSSNEYYYSPGDANRTHYCIPQKNQDLTKQVSSLTGPAMDSCGITSFTERGYDDFFIGKGACYGDVQGSVCLLHEQSGTFGHSRYFKKQKVERTFIETVRNQSVATMCVINSSFSIKKDLMEYQREFFQNAAKAATTDANKGYKFDARGNRGIAFNFIDNLLLHEIEVYEVAGEKGTYFVPFNQKHYYKIKTIFDDITEYNTSRFYDISTWSPVHAYNLNCSLVSTEPVLGEKITEAKFPAGAIEGGESSIAYLFSVAEYYTPYLMNDLQRKGVKLQVATKAFDYKCKAEKINRSFPAGTMVIPVEGQNVSAGELYAILAEESQKCAVDFVSVKADKKKSLDLNKLSLKEVRTPNVLLVTESGSANLVGENWMILDNRFNFKHSLVSLKQIESEKFDLSKFNVIIFAGSANSSKGAYEKIEKWVKDGGTLILEGASNVCGRIHQPKIATIEKDDKTKKLSGIVLKADVKEADSPMLWGYEQSQIPVFKHGSTTYAMPDKAKTILAWGSDPYVSGWKDDDNMAAIAKNPAVVATIAAGKGHIVFFAEDINFRSYWYGTTHLLTNSIFFGDML